MVVPLFWLGTVTVFFSSWRRSLYSYLDVTSSWFGIVVVMALIVPSTELSVVPSALTPV